MLGFNIELKLLVYCFWSNVFNLSCVIILPKICQKIKQKIKQPLMVIFDKFSLIVLVNYFKLVLGDLNFRLIRGLSLVVL